MSASPIRGSLDGSRLRVGIVVARFNDAVTGRLLEGAIEGLREARVADGHVKTCSVPGAVEIPAAAQALARSGGIDAVVALGAVIRGETSHYDYVCRMAADGCLRVALDTGVPVAFGVLTCETEEQALSRAGSREMNKGFEAALVAVEMANLLRSLRA